MKPLPQQGGDCHCHMHLKQTSGKPRLLTITVVVGVHDHVRLRSNFAAQLQWSIFFFFFEFPPKATRAGDEKQRNKKQWPKIPLPRQTSCRTLLDQTAQHRSLGIDRANDLPCGRGDDSETCKHIGSSSASHWVFRAQHSIVARAAETSRLRTNSFCSRAQHHQNTASQKRSCTIMYLPS